MRLSVESFAEGMEAKLKTKDDERGEHGWGKCSTQYLIERLKEEMIEVEEAFENCNPAEVMRECIDVANFAMMIHDNLLQRKIHNGE